MMNDTNQFDSSSLIGFLWEHKWTIILICGIASLAAAIFSSPIFITPKYKSSVVMFPSSTNSISRALFSKDGKEDVMEFGEEEDIERMIQILNSDMIREKITQKYDLFNHYELKSDDPYINTKLMKEYKENISFRATKFNSVEIEVLDKDPQTAANIANDISNLLDSAKTKMLRGRAIKAFELAKYQVDNALNELSIIEDSLTVLRKLGIIDYESQTEMLTGQLAITLANNNIRGQKAIEERLDVFAKYGSKFVSLEQRVEAKTEILELSKDQLDMISLDVNSDIPSKFVVNRAFRADKKSYPVRWLIVALSGIFSFIFAVLFIIARDKIKTINKG